MSTTYDENWDQLKVDLEVIKDFNEDQAIRWLERHGYGPTLRDEAMSKRVKALVIRPADRTEVYKEMVEPVKEKIVKSVDKKEKKNTFKFF